MPSGTAPGNHRADLQQDSSRAPRRSQRPTPTEIQILVTSGALHHDVEHVIRTSTVVAPPHPHPEACCRTGADSVQARRIRVRRVGATSDLVSSVGRWRADLQRSNAWSEHLSGGSQWTDQPARRRTGSLDRWQPTRTPAESTSTVCKSTPLTDDHVSSRHFSAVWQVHPFVATPFAFGQNEGASASFLAPSRAC